MAETTIDILAILKHYFKLDLKSTEAAHIIWEVGENKIYLSVELKIYLSVLCVVSWHLK